MTERTFTVAAFTLRPRCKKCDNEGFRWEYREQVYRGDKTKIEPEKWAPCEHLHLTCDRCGAAFDMQTREGSK